MAISPIVLTTIPTLVRPAAGRPILVRGDVLAQTRVRYTESWSTQDYLLIEWDSVTRACLVMRRTGGTEIELGYLTVAQLDAQRGPAGEELTQDVAYTPRPI